MGISICGTLPTFVIKKMFEKSVPIEVYSNNAISPALDAMNVSKEDIGKIVKKSATMGEFSDKITTIHGEDPKNKYTVMQNVRKELLNSMYPLPHYCKKIAWILLIIWSAAASV